MKSILHVFLRFWLGFIVVLASGCMMGTNLAHSSTELSALYSPYQYSAQTYLSQAQDAEEGQKQVYELLAAGRWLSEGQLNSAAELLNQIRPINTQQSSEKQILVAKLYYLQHQASQAIQKLASVRHLDTLDIYFQCEYHELLALAYQSEQQYTEAALQRMKLDAILTDQQAQLINRQKMWGILQDMPPAELDIQYLEADSQSIWKGWLKLVKIMRGSNFYEDWDKWVIEYPNHPAQAIVKKPSMFHFIRPKEMHNPHKIALLLPFSGSLSGPSQAIKDGFMAAHQQDGARTDVVFYDSNKGVLNQYQQAINDGVDVVVGPLSKPEAQAIASYSSSVPTLLLNDVHSNLSKTMFSLGYSPKEEAIQLASMMADRGHHRVLMITPNSAWGQEISQAFGKTAYQHHIQIVENVRYQGHQNFSYLLKDALHYSEHKDKGSLGKGKLIGSRRQDFDAIFIVAYPSDARQIVPLLKYYYAGDVPMYATSAAYDAYLNPSQDKDLNGLFFLDIPWVFSHQVGHRAWPEPWNTYSRLYALGYDSYDLIKQWSFLQSMPQSGLTKQTGVLYVMPNGHIRRELILGQIRQGVAREVPSNWVNLNF